MSEVCLFFSGEERKDGGLRRDLWIIPSFRVGLGKTSAGKRLKEEEEKDIRGNGW